MVIRSVGGEPAPEALGGAACGAGGAALAANVVSKRKLKADST